MVDHLAKSTVILPLSTPRPEAFNDFNIIGNLTVDVLFIAGILKLMKRPLVIFVCPTFISDEQQVYCTVASR